MAVVIPTAAEVRARSRVDFDRYGYEIDDTATPSDPIEEEIDAAVEYLEWVTCRTPFADAVPDALADTARRAIRMRVEQQVFVAQPEQAETAADDMISSFSAGSYSETRRDHAERRFVNSWPALEELLWALMTEECTDLWDERLTGRVTPHSAIQEIEPRPLGPFGELGPEL